MFSLSPFPPFPTSFLLPATSEEAAAIDQSALSKRPQFPSNPGNSACYICVSATATSPVFSPLLCISTCNRFYAHLRTFSVPPQGASLQLLLLVFLIPGVSSTSVCPFLLMLFIGFNILMSF